MKKQSHETVVTYGKVITLAKQKIDFTQEAKDYCGSHWNKLTETEKNQIIAEIERNFLRSTHF